MGWILYYYSNIPTNYGSRLKPSDTVDDFPGVDDRLSANSVGLPGTGRRQIPLVHSRHAGLAVDCQGKEDRPAADMQ